MHTICSDIQGWKNYLTRALDVIEIWKKIQKNWLCLQPMFASTELVLQLPKESTQFESINDMWTTVMANTKQNPSVMEALFQGRQYEAYEKANKQLEMILKGINDYLEKKRLQFPRFFFFSNEDLVFFLSREKEPASLEPYLHKCFEGIVRLEIKDGTTISGTVSESQELIEFAEPISLLQRVEDKQTSRNVEEWLKEIETGLTASLRQSYVRAFQHSKDEAKKAPQQIAQLVGQIEWTQKAEAAIEKKRIKELGEDYTAKIQELVGQARDEDEKLTDSERRELASLIMLNSRNREVLERLQTLDVHETSEFEWQSELRYYPLKAGEVACRIFSGARNYGFDYLVDGSRLVVTPLTVRCYRTLLSSLSQYMGGAAEGAPGIGKTETTKDLGKALGKCCMVFSGSAVLQVDSIARLFKGVASSGIWVCIDEFNKIHLEVLSVVSQYVQAIFRGMKFNAGIVDLQESTTILNSQCGIFVTFNPGLSRGVMAAELPENLKIMFRTITMVCPDRMKIAEVTLASYGFREAKTLAQAMVSSFAVAQSQLSAKEHYDFSLRSLKNMLRTAGVMLHRKEEEEEEEEPQPEAASPVPETKVEEKKEEEEEKKDAGESLEKEDKESKSGSDEEETSKEAKPEEEEEEKKAEAEAAPEPEPATILTLEKAAPKKKRKPLPKDERAIVKKSLQDAYLPRLDSHDAIVFRNILVDNFPRSEPASSAGEDTYFAAGTSVELERAVDFACRIHNLQCTPALSRKLQQLNDVLTVRPSTILLGAPCTGKSTVISVLGTATSIVGAMESGGDKSAIEKLVEALESKEGKERLITEELNRQFLDGLKKLVADGCRGSGHEFVSLHWIEPKSFNMVDLYGEFDTRKSLWREGLLPHCIRKAITTSGAERHWIVFDGELDRSWSEGLYSALDDTRRLCLPNSECLMFPQSLCLLFETPSLSNASPATVGRCGIVMTTAGKDLEWKQVYDSWLETLPPQFRTNGYTELLGSLKKELLEPMMAHVWGPEGSVRLAGGCSAPWAVSSFAKVFECFLFGASTREQLELQHRQEENKQARREAYLKLEGAEVKAESPHAKQRAAALTIKRVIEVCTLYLQALVWSVGAAVATDSASSLFKWLHARFLKLRTSSESALEYLKDAETAFPPEGTQLGAVFFDPVTALWTSFANEMWKIDMTKDVLDLYSDDLLIPNEETCKYLWITRQVLTHNMNFMLVGPTDTGKSRVMRRVLEQSLPTDKWMKHSMQFSGKTSAGQVQELVESQFEKRVKNLYAPKAFGQRFLLYVDDMHLPQAHPREDQQPVELLRGLLCHRGLYDGKTHEFKEMINVQIAGSMGAGSRVDSRFARHFSMVQTTQLGESTLEHVFAQMTEWAFAKYEGELARYVNDIAGLTLNLYRQVAKSFLPVPAKCHYKFSLDAVVEVLKGLVAIPQSAYEELSDENAKLRLLYKVWMHECGRVFSDVLSDSRDRKQFSELLHSVAEESRQVPDWTQVAASSSAILFTNFVSPAGEYKEAALTEATEKVREAVGRYGKGLKTDISVVLCEPVVREVAQIARTLGVARRHGLLMGMGGHGRTRLTRLVCFLLDWAFVTVGIHRQFGKAEWRENLKQLYKTLGGTKKTVFLCSDQILGTEEGEDDCFVDDINSMLCSGEVPDLFSKKDREDLISDRKKKSYEEYMATAKSNLHVMLCTNPASNSLRR